jgi:hypothetical protein
MAIAKANNTRVKLAEFLKSFGKQKRFEFLNNCGLQGQLKGIDSYEILETLQRIAELKGRFVLVLVL